ncbi:MAG: hypothetical protein IJ577_07050 [Prevotella sp.]|nr:hypothetical protein [Prevotella sp.]
MKKKLYGGLTAVLALCLTFTLAGCKDDKEPSEEEKQQQAEEQADKDMADAATFWSVVGQLTDTPMPDNWQNATYEPSIGEPDGTNSAVRIVNCADEESAAASASDLLGTSITTATQSYTYQNDLVGTLTYHKTGGSSLATVDVSIQQMPGLSQIVYKTPEQIGENASFKGTAYYRFGDVVKKLNKDGEYDYWICVRPCLSFVSKTDSHWMTLSKLPSDYLKSQEKTVNGNKFKHQMPKNLANNSDHMQNMAEMVYAMTCPTDWAYNLGTNKGYQKLKYFKDLNYEKYFKYNNEWFFNNVANGWEAHDGDLFQTIFGLSREDLKAHVQAKGFAMVYGNATISSNDITLTVYKYDGTNLKTKSSVKSTGKWDYAAFDINQLMSKHYIDNEMVVADDGRYWVARYATGETLAKGSDATKFDTYKKMPNCEDVFVYNRDVEHFDMTEETLKATEPKVAGEHGNQKGYYQLGDIIKYNNRYYVCASNHDINGTARFITLNDQATHTTKTFPWKHDFGMTTEDVVYNDDMASAETATLWLANIVFKQAMCDQVRNAMRNRNLQQYTYQLVPETEKARGEYLDMTAQENQYVTNINEPTSVMGFSGYHFTNFDWAPPLYNNPDGEYYKLVQAVPYNYLLVDKMRYSTHLISSTDHWVPYLMMMEEDDLNNVRTYLQSHNEDEQQNVSGYFEWKDMGAYEAEYDWVDSHDKEVHYKKTYHIVKLAHYWYHIVITPAGSGDLGFVLDYTKDWLNHPDAQTKKAFELVPGSWIPRNITSREITFLDEGKRQTKYQSIYVKSEE